MDQLLEAISRLAQRQAQLTETLTQLSYGQDEMRLDIEGIKQSLTTMEQEQGAKLSALFDARELEFDANERITETLFRIDEKVNRIEGKLDRLSFKVATHDTQLRQVK